MATYDGKWIVSKLDVQLSASGMLQEGSRLTIASVSNQATVSITKGDGTTEDFVIDNPSGNELSKQKDKLYLKVKYIPGLDILVGSARDETDNAKNYHVFSAARSPLDGQWLVFAVINTKGSPLIKEDSKLSVNGDTLTYYPPSATTPSSLTITHNIGSLTKAYSTGSVRLGVRWVESGDRQYLIGNIGDSDSPLGEEYLMTDSNTDTFIAVKTS